MATRIEVLSQNGDLEVQDWVMIYGPQPDTRQTTMWVDFYQTLSEVSSKVELPIGQNLRSTVRAIKGGGRSKS